MKQFDLVYEQALNGIAKGLTAKEIADEHDLPVSKIKKQLKKGQKVEKEHTKSKETAKKIAKDHVFEVPNYYDKLKAVE